MMDRFHIVIANYNKLNSFVENFYSLKNFDNSADKIYILDCSSQENLSKQLKIADKLTKYKLRWHRNLFFIRRRNWNLNHGAQLDYIRLVAEGMVNKPQFAYFMQEHYLDKKRFVEGDTIPQEEIVDLDKIYRILRKIPKTVFFCARNGFRISATVPDLSLYGTNTQQYNLKHLKNSKDICFVVDGGNYCLDISVYLEHYRQSNKKYVSGNGSFSFSHVWETRLCKTLYDKGFYFFEGHRKMGFRTINELKSKYPDPGDIWGYFYNLPYAYFFYGRDIWRYNLRLTRDFCEELIKFVYFNFKHDYNTRLEFFYP